MRSRDGFTVTMTTTGSVTPRPEGNGNYYKWRGDPEWVPGDIRFRVENQPAPGGAANAGRKHARIDRFAVVLTEISAGGPVSDAHVREAGRLVGVGERTAREYRKALREQESTP
jgi:hypothetical protein